MNKQAFLRGFMRNADVQSCGMKLGLSEEFQAVKTPFLRIIFTYALFII